MAFIISLVLVLFLESTYGYKLNGIAASTIGIYGGTPIDINLVPFMAHYRPKYFSSYCGASIVDERFLVTAAHCYTLAEKKGIENIMYVTVGTDKTSEGEDYEIEHTFVHPYFSPLSFGSADFSYDIAVLKLERRLTFSDRVQSITMVDPDFEFKEGDVVTALGFGDTENGASSTLLSVDIPYVDQEECVTSYANTVYAVTDTMFCAGLNKMEGIRHGDSGSPVIYNGTLVGVASWVMPDSTVFNANMNFPCVFSRLSALRSFIDDVIKK